MSIDGIEEVSDEENLIREVPRELTKFPPPEGENGRMYSVCCPDEECGFWGDLITDYSRFDPSGNCPDCGKELRVDFERTHWGIAMKGAGYHETKIGQRMKRDRIKKSERLAKTQWDNHDASKFIVNPDMVRNPTSGSPLDPNSRFNKHKKKNTKIVYPGSSGGGS